MAAGSALIARPGDSSNNNSSGDVTQSPTEASGNGHCRLASTPSDSRTEAPLKADCEQSPPDGGLRGWSIMICGFLCNGIIFGLINTYGVIHIFVTEQLEKSGDHDASSKAALVGSLTIGTAFFLSPVAGCLTDKIGLRMTTFFGGVLATSGILLASFCVNSIVGLYLTYGVMYGVGAALAYTPTLAILGHYFKRYLGRVSGVVTAGSTVFTIILPECLDVLVKEFTLQTALQVMSLACAFVMVCAFIYKPLYVSTRVEEEKRGDESRTKSFFRSIVNVDNWRIRKYVVWVTCVPLALFGYFVPYVHMMKYVKTVFPGENANLPIMCLAVASVLGRLFFGVISDRPGVNRFRMHQLALASIGAMTMLLPLTSSYFLLICITMVMGLFDGCFIAILGPLAYEICGPKGASQGIGFLLGLCSFPMTLGAPIAGLLYDQWGSYTIPFIISGIPPIIGALLMFLGTCGDHQATFSPSIDVCDGAERTNGVVEERTNSNNHKAEV